MTECADGCYKHLRMDIKVKSMLSVAESASYLGKSTKTVRRYVKQGLLPCARVNGKYGAEIRIPRKALDRLVKILSKPSRPEDDTLDLIKLYRKATPEMRELVRKILTSTPEEEEEVPRGGFLRPFFRKRGGEKE